MTSLTHLEAWGAQITLHPPPQGHRHGPPSLPSDSDHFVRPWAKGQGRVLIHSGPNMYHRTEIYEGGVGEGYASSLKQTAIFNRQEWARLMRPATANCYKGLKGFQCQDIMMTG